MSDPRPHLGPLLDWGTSRAVTASVNALCAQGGISRPDLTAALGLAPPTVSALCRGGQRWRGQDAEKAAAFLGVTLAALSGTGEAAAVNRAPGNKEVKS